MERWDRWEDEEEKQDDFLFNSEEGRKEETRHIHSQTQLWTSWAWVWVLSLLSDEYHLQTKSKQRSLQGFVEEVQIVNADFWKEKGTTIAFLSCSSNAFK